MRWLLAILRDCFGILAVLGHGTLRDGGRCHDMGADSCRMQAVEAICRR